MWDTHALNADRLQDSLCPMFDVSFDALMGDLAERGLLDETLVVVIGEFRRTPKINKVGGRDHWGHVFSMALAGAGIRGGQVIGTSDRNGAYPVTDPIQGGDLTATIFHLLGIDPNGMFRDKANRPHPITKGEPILAALGNAPASTDRCKPEGDANLVPPYDASWLLDTDFDPKRAGGDRPAVAREGLARDPITAMGFAVRRGEKGVWIGYDSGDKVTSIEAGASAILAQEIRNARGRSVHVPNRSDWRRECDGRSSRASSRTLPVGSCCSAVVIGTKTRARVVKWLLRSSDPRSGKPGRFKLDKFWPRPPRVNFSIGNGLGVGVVVVKKTGGTLARCEE